MEILEKLASLDATFVISFLKGYSISLIILGLVSLMFGYKVMRYFISIYSGLLAMLLGSVYFPNLNNMILIALSIAVAVVSFRFYKFFIVITYGTTFYVLLLAVFFMTTNLDYLMINRLSMSLGFTIAIFIMMFTKPVTIVVSSLSGASQVVTGLSILTPTVMTSPVSWVTLIMLSLIGLTYQFKNPYDYSID